MDQPSSPLVTVLLPVYNGARYLGPAIDSVLSQTYTNLELLIIDDGSTDSTVGIISSYSDPRIRLIRNDGNSGIVFTMNRGISLAYGIFIARMDADDICMPQRLQRQVDYLLAHPDVTMVDVIMDYIDDNGARLHRHNNDIISEQAIRKQMAHSNCMGHSSIMMRTDAYRQYLYRKIFYEDDDLWLRLLNDGKRIHKIGEPLLLYRIHEQSIINKDRNKNLAFSKFVKTRWFYYSHLSGADRLKSFNLKVLFWIIVHFLILQYKKMKAGNGK